MGEIKRRDALHPVGAHTSAGQEHKAAQSRQSMKGRRAGGEEVTGAAEISQSCPFLSRVTCLAVWQVLASAHSHPEAGCGGLRTGTQRGPHPNLLSV